MVFGVACLTFKEAEVGNSIPRVSPCGGEEKEEKGQHFVQAGAL